MKEQNELERPESTQVRSGSKGDCDLLICMEGDGVKYLRKSALGLSLKDFK